MQKRRLGRTDLFIAPIVFGGNVFGWTADKETSFALLDRFAAAGLDAIDTADCYSTWAPGNKGGELETIIGEWMKAPPQSQRDDRRHQGRLADGAGQEGALRPLYRGGGRGVVEAAADRHHRPLSLALAGRGDALRGDARRLPAADRQRQDPLLRRLESERGPARRRARRRRRRKACRATRCWNPNTISTIAPRSTGRLRDLCIAEGIGVITYYSLAKGFLSGKYRGEADLGQSPRGGGVKGYLNARGFRILAALDEVAARRGVEPAVVALAWIVAQPRRHARRSPAPPRSRKSKASSARRRWSSAPRTSRRSTWPARLRPRGRPDPRPIVARGV